MFPILAIDYGQKRIGLAISDSKGIVSTPLLTISFSKNRGILEIVSDILNIAQEYKSKTLLIGKPQEFEIEQSSNTRRIDDFANTIKKRTDIPIIFWDESFSTSTAKGMIVSKGSHFKSKKVNIDSIAASIFLQEYLNSKQN